jgi:hypothetical protein
MTALHTTRHISPSKRFLLLAAVLVLVTGCGEDLGAVKCSYGAWSFYDLSSDQSLDCSQVRPVIDCWVGDLPKAYASDLKTLQSFEYKVIWRDQVYWGKRKMVGEHSWKHKEINLSKRASFIESGFIHEMAHGLYWSQFGNGNASHNDDPWWQRVEDDTKWTCNGGTWKKRKKD